MFILNFLTAKVTKIFLSAQRNPPKKSFLLHIYPLRVQNQAFFSLLRVFLLLLVSY